MNTSSALSVQTKNDEPTPKSYRRLRSLADRAESDVSRFLAIVAPNPDDYHGTWSCGEKPTLYGEFVDGGGSRKWDVLRDADPHAAMGAHVEAGMRQEPISVAGNDQGPIRSIALRYDFDSVTEFVSVDLDGGYPAIEVVERLKNFFGPDAILPHSGSGTEGRFRVLIRLIKPMSVLDMQSHMHAVCVHIGFPVKGGHLEISPGNAPSRTPFGDGGCQLFSFDLEKVGPPSFDAAVSAFLNLTPVDLEKLASGLDDPGIDTGIHRTVGGRYDPYTRIERARSRPRAMRRLISEGITGPGQRNRAIYLFVRDCLFSGYNWSQAVDRLVAWIEAGKLDASRDIQKHGRQWQIRQVVGTVLKLYATIPPLGIPDPIPLTSEEIREVKRIAKEVSARSDYSRGRVERFLLRVLPWYKGACAAGLPMLRMHSRKWESFDRDYRELRALTGLFRAETGYRSRASVRAKKHLGARDCEAHARSYSCRFAFRIAKDDVPSYVLSTQGKRVVQSSDKPKDPPNVFVCNIPSTPAQPSRSTVDTLDSLTLSPSAQPPTLQLYVRQSEIALKHRGSDRPLSTPETEEQGIPSRHPVESDPAFASDAPLPQRKKRKKRRSAPPVYFDTPVQTKPKEWQRIAKWSAPCTDDMGLDEWLGATRSAVREYNRERARAIADRKHIERTQGVRLSLGQVASKRFHELRKLFGLEPWR